MNTPTTPAPMDAPLLMQDDDPSESQLKALMQEVATLARQRKAATEKILAETLHSETQAALSRLPTIVKR